MITFASDVLPLIFPRLLNCPCCYVFYSPPPPIAMITQQKLGDSVGQLSYSAVHTNWQSRTHEGSFFRQSKTRTFKFIGDLSK